MIQRTFFLATALACFALLPGACEAHQYTVYTPEGPKVVHTRLAPVIFHRVLPPYWGKHVYEGNLRPRRY